MAPARGVAPTQRSSTTSCAPLPRSAVGSCRPTAAGCRSSTATARTTCACGCARAPSAPHRGAASPTSSAAAPRAAASTARRGGTAPSRGQGAPRAARVAFHDARSTTAPPQRGRSPTGTPAPTATATVPGFRAATSPSGVTSAARRSEVTPTCRPTSGVWSAASAPPWAGTVRSRTASARQTPARGTPFAGETTRTAPRSTQTATRTTTQTARATTVCSRCGVRPSSWSAPPTTATATPATTTSVGTRFTQDESTSEHIEIAWTAPPRALCYISTFAKSRLTSKQHKRCGQQPREERREWRERGWQ